MTPPPEQIDHTIDDRLRHLDFLHGLPWRHEA